MKRLATDDVYSLQAGGERLMLVPIYFGAQSSEQLPHECELLQVGLPAPAFHDLGTGTRSHHIAQHTTDTRSRLLDK